MLESIMIDNSFRGTATIEGDVRIEGESGAET